MIFASGLCFRFSNVSAGGKLTNGSVLEVFSFASVFVCRLSVRRVNIVLGFRGVNPLSVSFGIAGNSDPSYELFV